MRRDEGPTDRAGRECPRTPALPARIAGRVRLPATQEGVSAGPDVFVGRDVSAGRSASAKRDAVDGFRASAHSVRVLPRRENDGTERNGFCNGVRRRRLHDAKPSKRHAACRRGWRTAGIAEAIETAERR